MTQSFGTMSVVRDEVGYTAVSPGGGSRTPPPPTPPPTTSEPAPEERMPDITQQLRAAQAETQAVVAEQVASAFRAAADHLGPAGQKRSHDGFVFRPSEAPSIYAIANYLLGRDPSEWEGHIKRLRAATAQAAAKAGVNLHA